MSSTLGQISKPSMSRRDAIKYGLGSAIAGLLSSTTAMVASERDTAAARLSMATDVDREFFTREIDSFLPDKIFDAHTHLYKQGAAWDLKGFPSQVGYGEYQELIQDIHGKRRTAALFLPAFSPDKRDRIPECNAWIGEQVAQTKDCVGAYFVQPDDDPERVRQDMKRLKLRGFKCYHQMAPKAPTWEAEIPDYLPERLVKLAHEEGWCITLHMVRSRAAADEGNQRWIRRYCRE